MADEKYRGKLIVFEGPEGAGKSTVIKALAAALVNNDYNVEVTKEPGHNTPLGRQIREILLNPDNVLSPQKELDLFIKGRADHFGKIIIPALKRGKIIFCDRSSPSTIAYQHYGRGLDLTEIMLKDVKARRNVNFDRIILLDLDPEIGLKRKKPETRFELETIDFHRRVRNGYLEQARNDPDKRWRIIDASQPIEQVLGRVVGAVVPLVYGLKKGK